MIRRPADSELVDAAELVWNHCLSPRTASYPLPETHGRVEVSFRRAMERGGDTLLCSFDESGALCGVLSYFLLPGDRYLQSNAFCAGSDEAAFELLSALIARHPGYAAHLGFSAENARMARLLTENGFAVTEKSADLRLARAAFLPDPAPAAAPVRITAETAAAYASLHDAAFPGSYWSMARIFSAPEQWISYLLLQDGAPRGWIDLTVFGSAAEIFGLALDPGYDTPEAARTLLSSALSTLYAEQPAVNGVVFFAGENDVFALAAAKSTGFTMFGRYRLYERTL